MPTPAQQAPEVEIWVNPDALTKQVVAMNREAVLYGSTSDTSADGVRALLKSGKDLNAIPVQRLTYVRANVHDNEVTLQFSESEKSKKKAEVTVTVSSDKERRAIMESLRRRLGSSWIVDHKELSVVQAMKGPAIFLIIVAGLTWLAYAMTLEMAAGEEVSASGRRAGIKRLFVWLADMLGPTGVLIVGGITFVLGILVLVQRIKQPPIYDDLKRAAA